MRKIIAIACALLLSATVVRADNEDVKVSRHIENVSALDNWFTGISGAATWTSKRGWAPSVTAKLGKYATPVVGVQLDAEIGFGEGTKTFVDQTDISLLGLVNFSNWFCGYKGRPRVFEIVGEVGGGWYHLYAADANYATIKAGLEFNFNMGRKRAWQINVVPTYTYIPQLAVKHSFLSIALGTTYKFKCHNGTHNFVLTECVDKDDYDALNDRVNVLLASNAALRDQLDSFVPVTVTDTVYVNVVSPSNIVSFNINSAEIGATQMANLWHIANAMLGNGDLKVIIRAYADAETGSAEYNQELSEKRAQSVADVLTERYGIDPARITIEALGSTEQPYGENDWNRVVIFTF